MVKGTRTRGTITLSERTEVEPITTQVRLVGRGFWISIPFLASCLSGVEGVTLEKIEKKKGI